MGEKYNHQGHPDNESEELDYERRKTEGLSIPPQEEEDLGKPIFEPILPTAPVLPLGLGSTGRSTATTLYEDLSMQQAMSDPTAGRVLPVPMTDSRWPGTEGWVKMSQNINVIEIHYVRNTKTGWIDDFKFKWGGVGMRLKCIATTGAIIPVEQRHLFEVDVTNYSPLKVGQYYEAHAMMLIKDRIDYFVAGVDCSPMWAPESLFELVDNDVPVGWCVSCLKQEGYRELKEAFSLSILLGRKDLLSDFDYYVAVVEHEDQALARFYGQGLSMPKINGNQ